MASGDFPLCPRHPPPLSDVTAAPNCRLAIVVVIAFAFASELGSVATFAGLLTAGVAVALQNVILSIAGYFFLIGKFGLRIGDRVQISGVTGEVVEIGLVRIHVMELGGNGGDVQPTGRVVAFSSSFVFQPTAGMFKQFTRLSTIRSPRRPGGIA